MQHAVKHDHVLPYELDTACCYKLMNMATSHAIRPARQTQTRCLIQPIIAVAIWTRRSLLL